jgi:hypothetical protein
MVLVVGILFSKSYLGQFQGRVSQEVPTLYAPNLYELLLCLKQTGSVEEYGAQFELYAGTSKDSRARVSQRHIS